MAAAQLATTTLLFTDIEGSTRLLQELGERYAEVLVAHHRLVRTAVEQAGGREIGTQGDAVFASFPRASDALRAAVAAQHALAAHAWPDGARLRVRMGMHSGEIRHTEVGYVGLNVHRAARISAAAHGGQILLSEAARALAEDDFPPGVEVRDMGLLRLKDLARAQHLYQVLAPGLPHSFPPLRTLEALPNNLPIQLTSFIGREAELKELRRMLSTTRLLTLLGPGGTGKTRLAVQAAADVLEEFRDGVWLVELAPLEEPELVPQTLASALGIRELAHSVVDVLRDFVRSKTMLIVLDNCEHLTAACAELSRAILQIAPSVRIIATTREALGLPGELSYPVQPLSLPDGGGTPPDDLTAFEAVRLFVERAAFYKPGFMISHSNAAAIAQICRRLDGLPLAIELAAARVRVLSVDQIAARLEDRFRLLTGGIRTDLPHHRTLRAAMDWSHDLLNPSEQILFRRLSAFAGGFTLEAAEEVGAGDGVTREAVLDLLTGLVDKSWVIAEEQGAEVRYRMLETVREYGRNRLGEADDVRAVHDAHLQWFATLAERAEPELQGPEQEAWLQRLETEHDNMRAALGWARGEPAALEGALRLAAALWKFWEVRGFLDEGRQWLEELLARAGDRAAHLRARILQGIGFLALRQGDFKRVATAGEESLSLSRAEGDLRTTASALAILGLNACNRTDYTAAEALGGESLTLCRRVGDKWGQAYSLHVLGLVARYRDEYDRARALLEEGAALYEELGDRWALAIALNDQGLVAREQGDLPRALRLTEQGLAYSRGIGDKWAVAAGLSNLGILAWRQGDSKRADELFRESLAIRRDLQDRPGIAVCLVGLGVLAESTGRMQHAARLFAAAEALREALNGRLPPFIRDSYEEHVTAIREALGAEAFAAAWAAGRATTLDEAIAAGLQDEAPAR